MYMLAAKGKVRKQANMVSRRISEEKSFLKGDGHQENNSRRDSKCHLVNIVFQGSVLVHQLRPALCDPMDCSQPGSSIHGIFQARVLEWGAIAFSTINNYIVIREGKGKSPSRVRLLATPWTVAYQAPPSIGFSRQNFWSGLPFPSPGKKT